MDKHYQGLFVADTKGLLYTGILDDGKEYKGSDISSRDYFMEAEKTGKTIVSEVVLSKSTGKSIAAVCAPIHSENKVFLGTFGVVVRAEYFTNLLSERKIGNTGYGYMIDRKGIVIAYPNADLLFKLDLAKIKEMEQIINKMIAGESGVDRYTFKGTDKIAGFAPVGINGWSICATQNEEEFLNSSHQIRNSTLIVILIAGAIGIILIFFAAQSIVKPINATIAGLKEISKGEGDLTKRLEVKSKDEVGLLSQVFNTFIDKLQKMIVDITQSVATLSSSSKELSSISQQMSEDSQKTSDHSNTVAVAAEEMAANMNSVAAAIEESTTNTNMVATAAEEMNATINEIAKNAEHARSISDNAVLKVNESTQKMNELGLAAKAINKVVETITDISEQVNLLSLNATIEAARAGEADKGFAVVANEIKELAKQTSSASMDIKEKINNIQESSADTLTSITEISNVITSVNEIVSTIATAVEEQSSATKEITENISQASTGRQDVNENVNQSSAVAEKITQEISKVNQSAGEMARRSDQVKLSAEDLSKLAEQLTKLVGQFKA